MKTQTSFDSPKAAAEELRVEVLAQRKRRAELGKALLIAVAALVAFDRSGLGEIEGLADRVLAASAE